MVEYDALDVLRQYGAALAKPRKPTLSTISDISELPYPKQVIRAVVRGALQRLPDQIEPLKVAYVSLADFQELTDEDREALAIKLPEPGAADFKEQAGRLTAALDCLKGVQARADSERTNLVQDLKSMGLWKEAN